MFGFNYTLFFMLFLLFVLHYCYDRQEIRLGDNNYLNDIFYVKGYESIEIVFENINPKSVKCEDADEKNAFIVYPDPIGQSVHRKESIYKLSNIIPKMFTNWKCTLITFDNNNVIYKFEVQDITKQKVKVQVRGKTLDFAGMNTTVYEFIEGETVDWICIKNHNVSTHLSFKYYNSEVATLVDSDKIVGNVLEFQKLMTAHDDSSYIDCIYEARDDKFQDFTYRTIFQMKNEIRREDDFITVTVNNKKLTPVPPINNIYESLYKYKYVYGDELTISCERKGFYGVVSIENISKDLKNHVNDSVKSDSKYSYKIDTRSLGDSSHMICKYVQDDKELRSKIILYRNINQDPVTLDLRADNILYQYTKNMYEWVTEYKYSANEILNLKCITSSKRKVLLNVTGRKICDTGFTSKYVAHNSITLNASCYEKITCESKRHGHNTRRMIINLHQMPSPESSSSNVSGLEFGVAAGILSILAVIVCVICWHIRNKVVFVKRPFRIFENIETSIAVSSRQGEDNEYTYIENPYDENKYAYTVDNSLYHGKTETYSPRISSVPTENHYTEIDNSFKENQTKVLNPVSYENHNVIKNHTLVVNYSNLKPANLYENESDEKRDGNMGYSNVMTNSNKSYVNVQTKDENINKSVKEIKNVDLHK